MIGWRFVVCCFIELRDWGYRVGRVMVVVVFFLFFGDFCVWLEDFDIDSVFVILFYECMCVLGCVFGCLCV